MTAPWRVTGNDGQTSQVVTLGQAATFRNAVAAYQGSRQPENLRQAYAAALAPLDEATRAKLPAPQTLSGQPLAQVQQAFVALDALLTAQPNLDIVVAQASGQPFKPQNVVIRDGGANAGNGSDMSGVCGNYAPNGFFARLNWPLKLFITPVKDQGQRGTCWAFASTGYLETRERVVSDHEVNLSEQYLVNVHKRDAFADIDFFGEGDLPFGALNTFADRRLPVAPESAWTYNPSSSRAFTAGGSADGERGVCNGYSGPCSESTHQSPTACASLRVDFIFCGYERVDYSGLSGVNSDHAYPFWFNALGLGGPLPVGIVRGLLVNGQPVIASFDVHPGFDNPNRSTDDRGYVTDFTDRSRGGHIALIVGFIPDEFSQTAPSVPGGSGGGFFVIKNSWGCDFADSGYVYVPVRYAQRFFTSLTATNMPSTRGLNWTRNISALRQQPDLSSARILTPESGATFSVDAGNSPNYYKDVTLTGRATDTAGNPVPASRLRWSFTDIVAGTPVPSTRTLAGFGLTVMVRLVNPVRNSGRRLQIDLEVLNAAGAVLPPLIRHALITVYGAPD